MVKNIKKTKKKKKTSGRGLINSLINKLPFELHVPKYQYCGPGTRLEERLKRNDPGINELDRACKEHDIAYLKTSNTAERNLADDILAKKAWQRVKSKDAGLSERAVALGISGIMKAKSKIGFGVKKARKRNCKCKLRKIGEGVKTVKRNLKKKKAPILKIFREAVKNARSEIKIQKPKTVPDAAEIGLQAAKITIKNHKLPKKLGLPRIIPVPKIGGVLPLIPIFAGLSALGALVGGSAGVANAVVAANNAKRSLKESQRHNETMEAIALGGRNAKTGAGLYLKPYKNGLGLYLSPYPKNE